jgi:L-iditol 2-dehydrogenase
VAILGAGPVGLMTGAIAKASGAGAIYVTEPLAHRRAFALDYCANAAFNPAEEDVVQAIMQATGGRGVDVAFEAAGAATTPDQAARVTRPGGKVVVVGIPADDTMTMTASIIRRKGLTIKVVRRMKHTYPRAIRMVQRGLVDIAPLATAPLPAGTHRRAFELVAGYRDGVLRAIIQVGTAD